jgi:hypothetical protein
VYPDMPAADHVATLEMSIELSPQPCLEHSCGTVPSGISITELYLIKSARPSSASVQHRLKF